MGLPHRCASSQNTITWLDVLAGDALEKVARQMRLSLLKEAQREVVVQFVTGNDIFVSLPFRSRKSLYGLQINLPLLNSSLPFVGPQKSTSTKRADSLIV